VTKAHAESGPQNTGPTSGPKHFPDLDRLARLNAAMLPPQAGMLEADRHSYPSPPKRLHGGSGVSPTGGAGGGLLHEQPPVKKGLITRPS
jgi:hypothetical protein